MSSIKILNENIINFSADAIVNSSNSKLKPNSGINKAIFEAAGKEKLLRYFGEGVYCETGCAITSPAFNMNNTKYIIHAVGPDYRQSGKEGLLLLYRTYTSVLEQSKQQYINSIAMPLIGAGISGFPKDIAWKIAIRACRDFIAKKPNDDFTIYFLSQKKENVMLGRTILKTYENECKISEPNEKVLLEAVNKTVLQDAIIALTKYNSSDKENIKTKDIVYATLDERIIDGLLCLGQDYEYLKHIESVKKIQCSEMNIFQIRTMLTFIKQGEKFCNGHIYSYIEDKTILKLFLRVDDLLAKYEIGELQEMLEKEMHL